MNPFQLQPKTPISTTDPHIPIVNQRINCMWKLWCTSMPRIEQLNPVQHVLDPWAMCTPAVEAVLSATKSYAHLIVMVPPGLKLVQFTPLCGTSENQPVAPFPDTDKPIQRSQAKDIREYKSCQLTWPSSVVWNDFSPTLLTPSGLPPPYSIKANKRPDKALMESSMCVRVQGV